MLRALYDYGKAHPEILLPYGCAMRKVKYIIDITKGGAFVGIRKAENEEIICPTVGSATRGGGATANVLVEKASAAICLVSGIEEKKKKQIKRKHESFLSYFRDGADKIPAFVSVLTALTDVDILQTIQDAAVKHGLTAEDTVGFAVDNRLLSSIPEVIEWWSNRKREEEPPFDEKRLDLITGKPCIPARIFKTIDVSAAGGGQSSGVSLVSFNCPSFESYGLNEAQGFNAPMSQDTADCIIDAVTYLAKRARKIADAKVLHWYSRDLPSEDDVLFGNMFGWTTDDKASEGSDPDAMDAAADRLVASPITGEPPQDLSNTEYHIMMLKPNSARMSIRFYEVGTYADMYRHLQEWYSDMELSTGTGKAKYRSLNSLLYFLLSDVEAKAKDNKFRPVDFMAIPLLQSCLHGGPLPDAVASRALARARSQIYNKDAEIKPPVIQLLKLWINRRSQTGKEEKITKELNKTFDNVGYQCGRLLAVYAEIQALSNPNVKTNVVERYYTACSQNPASALGRLQSLSVHHLAKIGDGLRRILQDELTEIYSEIHEEIPRQMAMVDQSYFVVGFYQQQAEMKRRKAERHAAKLEEAAAA